MKLGNNLYLGIVLYLFCYIFLILGPEGESERVCLGIFICVRGWGISFICLFIIKCIVILHMDLYEETHINLLVRLAREAREANTSTKRFMALASAVSDILQTIKNSMALAVYAVLFIWLRHSSVIL